MEEEAATVSKLIKGLATLEKVKEKVKEENQLSMIGGKSETGSPYLRIWGSSRSLDALNHTPLVEMVVVPEEEDGVISCTLVSFRRDPIHSATFVTTDLDARTGLPCFLDYLQTRLGRSYSLCKGLAEATLPSSLPGHQSFSKCLVEREPNGGGHLLLRSRLCQVVRPGGAEDEDQCPACAQLFDKSLATPESSRFKDQPDPGREKSKSCPFESCSRTFRREKPYQRHLKSHNQLKCSSCKKIFASDSQLSTHMKRAHRQKEGNKDIADPGGTSLDHLSDRGEHEKCATEEAPQQSKQFSCGQCGAAYQYEKAFQKHFQTHRDDVGTDIFNCDQCNQIYQTEVQLKEHKENTHTPFVCDQCDSVSSSSKALEKHKRKMHPKAQDQCHLCGKNVKRTSMSSHVKMVHQGDEMRRHICNVCGNKYKTKTDLDRHYTKHTGSSIKHDIEVGICDILNHIWCYFFIKKCPHKVNFPQKSCVWAPL